jgi:hypothetical protein
VMAAAQLPPSAAALGQPSGPPAWKSILSWVSARLRGLRDPAGDPTVHGRTSERADRDRARVPRLDGLPAAAATRLILDSVDACTGQ